MTKTVTSSADKYRRCFETGSTVYTKATDIEPAKLFMRFSPGHHDHLKSDAQILAGRLYIAFVMMAMEIHPDNFYAQTRLIVEAAGWIANMA